MTPLPARSLPRLGIAVGLLVIGVVTGLASVAVQPSWWGLALAVLAPGAVLLALPRGWWSRLAFAVGWLVPVGLATLGRPEGDFAISADPGGYGFLLGALVLSGFALATLPALRRVSRAPRIAP